ncbi:sugar transferase [Pelagibacterium halotolerans]|uniref:sugar transferase n=1 Tax=Pelagibacterium halotolerans TaxID=531813 RepID=UPI00384DB8FF
MIKHGFDRVVSLLALISFAPFILLVIIAILITGGQAIRSEACMGESGRMIRLYRFGRPAARSPLARRLSVFLAQSGLEDMPLLFNVLRGELSLIGPRPNRDPGAPHTMRPGLFTPKAPIAEAQRALDLDYIEHFSLARDAAIARAAICEALGLTRTGKRRR